MALKNLARWIERIHWKQWKTGFRGHTVTVDDEPYIRQEIAERLFVELQHMIKRWKHERNLRFRFQQCLQLDSVLAKRPMTDEEAQMLLTAANEIADFQMVLLGGEHDAIRPSLCLAREVLRMTARAHLKARELM